MSSSTSTIEALGWQVEDRTEAVGGTTFWERGRARVLGAGCGLFLLATFVLYVQASATTAATVDESLARATSDVAAAVQRLVATGYSPPDALRLAVLDAETETRQVQVFGARGEPLYPHSYSSALLRWSAIEALNAGFYRRYSGTMDESVWGLQAQRLDFPGHGSFALVALADGTEVKAQQAALARHYLGMMLAGIMGFLLLAAVLQMRERALEERRFAAGSIALLPEAEEGLEQSIAA
jgi:hypothetical protein